MSFRLISFIIMSSLMISSPVLAFQGIVQSFGEGRTITWGNGEVVVVKPVEKATDAEGEPPSPLAVRKAASQARKLLLDMVMSVRIDGRRTVSAHLSGDDELASQVRGLIHNSLFEGPDMFAEAPTVKVSEALRGKLAELILPKTVQFQSGIPPRLSTATGPAFMSGDDLEAAGNGAGGYTGVIIDARGLKVTPALIPVIYGEDGLGAYGAFQVSRNDAIAKGVAAYATTAAPQALRNRVGNLPLTVKAVRAYGSWRTDLIISTQEAKLVRAVMQESESAAKCGVVIVIDAPKPAQEKAEQGRIAEGADA